MTPDKVDLVVEFSNPADPPKIDGVFILMENVWGLVALWIVMELA